MYICIVALFNLVSTHIQPLSMKLAKEESIYYPWMLKVDNSGFVFCLQCSMVSYISFVSPDSLEVFVQSILVFIIKDWILNLTLVYATICENRV
jgi:hypothetical protein